MATHERSREKLTSVQERYCQEYIKDFKGGAAYHRASGNPNMKYCIVQASKLNKLPKIIARQKVIATDILGPLEKELIGNVRFWENIRDGNMPGEKDGPLVRVSDVLDLFEEYNIPEGEEIYKAFEKLKRITVVKTQLNARMKASEMLAKWRQMFVEKSEVAVEGKVVIVDDIPEGK